jgi:predicted deacylase
MIHYKSSQDTLIIHRTEVPPGDKQIVRLPVGRLPSGNQVLIEAHIFRSAAEGPCALVLAGVHGDEINGVEIVRKALVENVFEQLQRGTIIAIPVLNVYGFINFSREVPDGKDVNRSFPGNTRGSLASRIARALTKKVLPLVDFGVDFHTGGRSHYNYPQIRYTEGNEQARQLARHFGAPYTLAKRPINRSLRKTAGMMGKPILVFEGGENLRFDPYAAEKGLSGLRRLLASQQMLDEEIDSSPSFEFQNSTWIRAARAGMFQWEKYAGEPVRKGEIIGFINDPYGKDSLSVTAPRDGHLLGHNNGPLVSQGDALFHLAY